MTKLILNFKSKDHKKIKNSKNYLGGKGINLAEMGKLGLPVPPGFTISTRVCDLFYKIWGFKKSFISFCKIWCKSINARDDGHNS